MENFINWSYYRLCWVRASALSWKVSWSAKISHRAKLDEVAFLGNVVVGKDVEIGRGSYVRSGLVQSAKIGKYCSIGYNVIIGPSEHNLECWTTSPYEAIDNEENPAITQLPERLVLIEDGVWIGANAIILQGAHIGARSVIASGSVVRSNIPSGEVWGGVPAKKIKLLK